MEGIIFNEKIRNGLVATGISLVAENAFASYTVTAANTGGRFLSKDLISYLYSRFDIMISNGMEHTRDSWFRVGHMGEFETSFDQIEYLLSAVASFK